MPMRNRSLIVGLLLALLLGVGAPLLAQDRLIDEEPSDLVTVPDGKETKTLKVYPIKLPDRRPPQNPKPSDKIKVRLIDDDESRDFEVAWRDIKKLELYEDRVLAEAESFTANQKFDEAYDYYAFLLREYPNTQRLQESIQAYLYLNTAASFRAKKYDDALALLEELLRKNPQYKHSEGSPSLMKVLGDICDRLLGQYLQKRDFKTARVLLARITKAHPDVKQEPFYAKTIQEMVAQAEQKRAEAREHLTAKRYTEAYDATAAMLDIWPEVEGAAQLATEMAEQYPLAMVAVEEFASQPSILRINNWADYRAGRLTDRRLIELRGVGAEGGKYVCPIGNCQWSDDVRSMTLALSPDSQIQAFDVFQVFLNSARADSAIFSPAWSHVLGGARVLRPGQVEITLLRGRTHVLPQALPAFPLQGEYFSQGWTGVYELAETTEKRARFVRSDGTIVQRPREVQERVYESPEEAILALERGEVDALDRIQPADLAAVRTIPSASVSRYAVPTLHVLVPNLDRPWTGSRTFRRAIMYGLNRAPILNEGLLQGTNLPGAQLISGPFPAPLAVNDPLSYAYDSDIAPHTYEPLLSATLLNLAKREQETLARSKEEEPLPFTGIVIGHSPTELPRIACKAMAKQLKAISIPCETKEIASGDEEAAKQCDFVYTELIIAEPVIDVGRLFGPTGLYPAINPHVRLAVREVEESTNWSEAGRALRRLHRVLYEDLTVLPLWQMPEHFAVRRNVEGLSAAPVSLYQDIDDWRVSPRLGRE